MRSDITRRAADLLLEARTSGSPLDALPAELMPQDAAEAYRIQDQVTASLGPIRGWKTAPSKAGVRFNWAPIPVAGVLADGAEVSLTAFPRGALELEIGFIVGNDLPPRDTPYTHAELVAALGDMRVCLELFSSRYADRASRSTMEILADAQNALGAVVGTGLSDWQGVDLGATELVLDYAAQTHRQAGGRLLDEVLDACTDLANATGRLGGLRAGQVIITGARIGPIAATSGGPVEGRIEPVGAVHATLS